MLKDEAEAAASGNNAEDVYSKFAAIAKMMRKDAGEDQEMINTDNNEESKDNKSGKEIAKVDAQSKIDETIASQIWLKELENSQSKAS